MGKIRAIQVSVTLGKLFNWVIKILDRSINGYHDVFRCPTQLSQDGVDPFFCLGYIQARSILQLVVAQLGHEPKRDVGDNEQSESVCVLGSFFMDEPQPKRRKCKKGNCVVVIDQ